MLEFPARLDDVGDELAQLSASGKGSFAPELVCSFKDLQGAVSTGTRTALDMMAWSAWHGSGCCGVHMQDTSRGAGHPLTDSRVAPLYECLQVSSQPRPSQQPAQQARRVAALVRLQAPRSLSLLPSRALRARWVASWAACLVAAAARRRSLLARLA
jgi:hypothetical protein